VCSAKYLYIPPLLISASFQAASGSFLRIISSVIHQGQFFKIELFKLTTTKAHSKEVAIQFRKDAMDFFKEESSGIPSCHGYLPAPDNGIDDLALNCIEVGSYMLNHDPKLGNWISGT
jgi:hypothetical protein